MPPAVVPGSAAGITVPSPAQVARGGKSPRQRHEIDAEWIAGIRKWWKKVVAEGKQFGGHTPAGYKKNDLDYNYIVKAADEAKEVVEKVQAAVEALRLDLLITKAFWKKGSEGPLWTPPFRGGEKRKDPALRVVDELDLAREELRDGVRYIEHFRNDMNPKGNPMAPGGVAQSAASTFKSADEFDFSVKGFSYKAAEVIEKVDKIISGTLLKNLSVLIKKSGDKIGRYSQAGEEFAPDVVHVGKFTIIFNDRPSQEPSKSVFYPGMAVERGGRRDVKHIPADVKPGTLASRKKLIQAAKEAIAALGRRKIGWLAYGRITSMPEGTYSKVFSVNKTAAMSYTRLGDEIHTYTDDPDPKSLVHELGHRYWFKFMSGADRHDFGKWFGKVEPVTSYGGTSPVEEFAETFAAWVFGGRFWKVRLSREQMQRFSQFIGRKRRTESRAEDLLFVFTG